MEQFVPEACDERTGWEAGFPLSRGARDGVPRFRNMSV